MSRRQGRIKVWKDDKGYGFIAPNEGGDDVFVHIRAIGGLSGRPTGGERVTYDVSRDQQGRWRAVDVMVIPDVAPSLRSQPVFDAPTRSPVPSLLITFASLFLAIIFFLGLVKVIPLAFAGCYIVLSLIALVVYWVDKSAAQSGEWRTKESTLHLLGLLGGWPGALIAQQLFRHKTKKEDFVVVFWLTVALNCAALGYFSSPAGQSLFR